MAQVNYFLLFLLVACLHRVSAQHEDFMFKEQGNDNKMTLSASKVIGPPGNELRARVRTPSLSNASLESESQNASDEDALKERSEGTSDVVRRPSGQSTASHQPNSRVAPQGRIRPVSSPLRLPASIPFRKRLHTKELSKKNRVEQVAGHENSLLTFDDRSIGKPYNPKEGNFYRYGLHMIPPALHEFILGAFGEMQVGDQRVLNIANALRGMTAPSTVDLKLGRQLAHPSASFLKRAGMKLSSRLTTSSRLGYRVSGARLVKTDGRVVKYVKGQASRLKAQQRSGFFCHLLDGVPASQRRARMTQLIDRVTQFAHALPKLRGTYIGTSLLIALDAGDVRVKWIDFAHSDPAETETDNTQEVRNGVWNLLQDLTNGRDLLASDCRAR